MLTAPSRRPAASAAGAKILAKYIKYLKLTIYFIKQIINKKDKYNKLTLK
jgi:hypothetical protein